MALEAARSAGVVVVSLPLVNQWTQDRTQGRTPRWRGVPPLHELAAGGVRVALASDNTRDQFYAYGDLDMLEVFAQVRGFQGLGPWAFQQTCAATLARAQRASRAAQACRMAHLDRPYGDWARAVTSTPADAMGLAGRCRLAAGAPADLVIFRGRRYSELLSRPQYDRVSHTPSGGAAGGRRGAALSPD